jgi:hypothetical protein
VGCCGGDRITKQTFPVKLSWRDTSAGARAERWTWRKKGFDRGAAMGALSYTFPVTVQHFGRARLLPSRSPRKNRLGGSLALPFPEQTLNATPVRCGDGFDDLATDSTHQGPSISLGNSAR